MVLAAVTIVCAVSAWVGAPQPQPPLPKSACTVRAVPQLAAEPASGQPAGELSGVQKQEINAQFVKIAAPAFAQFAAEPLARLVDTAYLGRLGSVALGGAGVAIAAQYAVAKLYNDPLLRSTISIIAAQEGSGADAQADAAASALLLALLVGVVQGMFYLAFAGPVLTAACVGPGSAMRVSALGYLRVCAVGAPTTTLWLVANGIFRGLGDTATPLLWVRSRRLEQ